ncbi:hypothetical protein EV681_2996 [Advenella incenata]|uniref:Uncharacterized protein n=1 Tax=Advenella incenata TaxID=267800 RepID=A0A4Q7VCV3_9BURK|nr:hypothetical protein EV681_2996 [Advenella incenata]
MTRDTSISQSMKHHHNWLTMQAFYFTMINFHRPDRTTLSGDEQEPLALCTSSGIVLCCPRRAVGFARSNPVVAGGGAGIHFATPDYLAIGT